MYDAEFTTLLFRFLQLTGEGHNNGEFSKIIFKHILTIFGAFYEKSL